MKENWYATMLSYPSPGNLSDRIAVKIGLEIDYIEGAEDLLAPFFDNFTLDFCLCSIHCIPGSMEASI